MSEFFRKPIVKTLMLKGQEGQSIKEIKKTSTSGLADTYTITLTDGTTSTFSVKNGKGISSISKTGTSGLVDTYTIRFNDGTTSIFTVTNGAKGDIGEPTNEQTNNAVKKWLDEHPEATTTVQDGSIEEIKINKNFLPWIKKDYVTPEMFGAVGDGIHDDSEAIQKAINSGAKVISFNGNYYIEKTINLKFSHQDIIGNSSFLIIADGITAFELGKSQNEYPLINVKIKDFFIEMGDSSNFLISYNNYFVYLEDIRITNIRGNGIGVKIVNGFNITFRNVNIKGIANDVNSDTDGEISKNSAIGIWICGDRNVPSTASVGVNVTNVLVDSCLIQKCKQGIFIDSAIETGAVFDTNQMKNVGFSSCDVAIDLSGGAVYNQTIDTIRAEYCGIMLRNSKYVSVGNIYCYNTTYLIENYGEDTPYTNFFGVLQHWNSSVNGYVIKNNTGNLNFSTLGFLNYTSTVKPYDNEQIGFSCGNIQQLDLKMERTVSSISALNVLEKVTYDVNTTYLDLSKNTILPSYKDTDGNMQYIDGTEFYLIKTNDISGCNVNLGTQSIMFDHIPNEKIHCIVKNGKIYTVGDGRHSVNRRNTTTSEGGYKVPNMLTTITNVGASLSQVIFDANGISILYSDTEGVTLNDYTNVINNFASINNGNPIPLYNNPIILVSSGVKNKSKEYTGYIIANKISNT